ncbi:MAG: hypothetical protein CMM07_18370 [Rhodopirellula sp.]|nr:hypothetical protein [Rhodopirellula sp.]
MQLHDSVLAKGKIFGSVAGLETINFCCTAKLSIYIHFGVSLTRNMGPDPPTCALQQAPLIAQMKLRLLHSP